MTEDGSMKGWARLVLVGTLALAVTRVEAGLFDSPAPSFGEGPGKVVYRMGPVHYDTGWVDTIIVCDNLADVTAGIGIEFFDGKNEAAGLVTRVSVPAGGKVTFATSADAGGPGATVVLGLPQMEDGKARVSATTASLSCSGKHRVRSSDGGTREIPLELVKKVALGD